MKKESIFVSIENMFALNAATIDDEDDTQLSMKNRKKIPREMYEKRAVITNNNTDVETFQNQKVGSNNYAALADFPSMSSFPPLALSAGDERMATRQKKQTQKDHNHHHHQNQNHHQNHTHNEQQPGISVNEGFSSYTNPPAMTYNWNNNNNSSLSSSSSSSSANKPKDQMELLVMKLNYVISLLEEQQDEKTNNVPEEVILYCFLGIFVIFIVDSFVRVGKYVR